MCLKERDATFVQAESHTPSRWARPIRRATPGPPSVRSTLGDYHLVALYFEGPAPEPEDDLRGAAQLYIHLVHTAI